MSAETKIASQLVHKILFAQIFMCGSVSHLMFQRDPAVG